MQKIHERRYHINERTKKSLKKIFLRETITKYIENNQSIQRDKHWGLTFGALILNMRATKILKLPLKGETGLKGPLRGVKYTKGATKGRQWASHRRIGKIFVTSFLQLNVSTILSKGSFSISSPQKIARYSPIQNEFTNSPCEKRIQIFSVTLHVSIQFQCSNFPALFFHQEFCIGHKNSPIQPAAPIC